MHISQKIKYSQLCEITESISSDKLTIITNNKIEIIICKEKTVFTSEVERSYNNKRKYLINNKNFTLSSSYKGGI